MHGALRIAPFNAPGDSVLLHARRWWLDSDTPLRIRRARAQGEAIVAEPEGLADRDEALRLKGRRVSVRRADFPPNAPDEYYWIDLVGCRVVNAAGHDFGAVSAVDDHGAHPLLAIEHADAPTTLIPFVEPILRSVDLAARRIEVDWEPDY